MDEPEIDIDETLMLGAVDDTVCNICCAEFLDVEDLQMHIAQVHLNEKRKLRFCVICVKIFGDIEQYMAHMLHEHLATLECCKHCFRLFPDLNSKMSHEKKHKYRCKKEIFCSQCSECFNDKIFLERHEFKAHLDCGEGIMLNHGYSVLSSLLNMNVRRFLCSYNEEMTYVCARCQFSSVSMEAYLNHIKLTACQTYACDMCLNVYLRKKNLIRHFLSRHGHNDKHNIVECPKCQVMYTRSALKVHEKTCSMLKCLECNIMFKSVTDITNHKVRVHQECILVERCRFCNRQVIGHDNMKKHIERTHQGTMHLYKYKCVYCDLIFNHPKKLFGHFFSSHKDLEPYTCNICDKKFRIRKKFTVHVHAMHHNIGFLEFNENYHVSFSAKKSEKTFVPQSIYFDSVVIESNDEDDKPDDIKTTTSQEIGAGNESTKKSLADEETTDVDAKSETVKNGNRKRVFKKRQVKHRTKVTDFDSDDSDVPLQNFCKQSSFNFGRAPWNTKKNKKIFQPKTSFTCEKCNKNCYTSQNYQYHMSLHAEHGTKKCFKCEATFQTESALKEHMDAEHKNSGLIETLKRVLERQKLQTVKSKEDICLNRQDRFKVNLKKVICVDSETPATMTIVTDNTSKSKKESVKNFIENFMPDLSTDGVRVKDCVTMRITSEVKPPTITLQRCDPRPMDFTSGLKKPVPFKHINDERHRVDVKLVYGEIKRAKLNYGDKLCTLNRQNSVLNEDHSYCEEYHPNDDVDDNNDDDDYRSQQIPEVAEEVMLATEEIKTHQTITVPNVPSEYKSIRIGTLQPQAPYYKILKIDDILKGETDDEETKKGDGKYVSLPDGTQLVAVNPLAHLIDTDGLKKKMPKKYYKPKQKDIGAAISKFLTSTPKKKSRKKSVNFNV
ncbi:zinc finger protein 791-like [Zerene cesonia]|uniref:zinc finger protein 791-like n=1 Tax=Zerene cesonia TaxID=33412 RepID=UPI0018E53B30|nr:zinc finger protein 791-like [Zerene cesonia]